MDFWQETDFSSHRCCCQRFPEYQRQHPIHLRNLQQFDNAELNKENNYGQPIEILKVFNPPQYLAF